MRRQSYIGNSIPLFFTSLPLLYATVVFGVVVLVHSFYMHGTKIKPVRVLSDLSAICMILEAVCFIIIMAQPSPSAVESVVLLNIFGNSVFGAVLDACDNYLTFTRYQAVAGGTSRNHKIAAFSYVVLINFLTWWEFTSIMPAFANMNDPTWVLAQYYLGVWINFLGYISYDAFYTGMVVFLLVKHVRSSSVKGGNQLIILAGNAVGHTVMSCCSILCYAFTFPLGIMIQNILLVMGMHVFLNCSFFRYLDPDRAGTAAANKNRASAPGTAKTSTSKVVPVTAAVEEGPITATATVTAAVLDEHDDL